MIRVGTAGWSIPRVHADAFPREGSGLERYAAVFGAVEVNSSFYRAHKPSVWERWANAVPDYFRFSVKLPKAATHEARLVGCEAVLDRFAHETSALGPKRGPVLVQLPPSLVFDVAIATSFFRAVRERLVGPVACEPRHGSWFEPDANTVLVDHDVARVAADPARAANANFPGGASGLAYWRLHGSPQIYRTPYGDRLAPLIDEMLAANGEVWCIFDNTMSGAATGDALAVATRISL